MKGAAWGLQRKKGEKRMKGAPTPCSRPQVGPTSECVAKMNRDYIGHQESWIFVPTVLHTDAMILRA